MLQILSQTTIIQTFNFLLLLLIGILTLLQQAMHMQKPLHKHLLKIFNPLKYLTSNILEKYDKKARLIFC